MSSEALTKILEAVAQVGVPAVLLAYTLHKLLFPLVARVEALTARVELLTLAIAQDKGLDMAQLVKQHEGTKGAA